MDKDKSIAPEVVAAVQSIANFIAETTGQEATTAELADALKRYFVLHEIKEHILMLREDDVD